jgi:hypothetical protein
MTDENTQDTRNREALAAYTAWAEAFADALPGETTVAVTQTKHWPGWVMQYPDSPSVYTTATVVDGSGTTVKLTWDHNILAGFIGIRSEYDVDEHHGLWGPRIELPAGIDPVAAASIVETTVLAHNRASAIRRRHQDAAVAAYIAQRLAALAPLIETGVTVTDPGALRSGWDTVLRTADKAVKVTVADNSIDEVTVRLRSLTLDQAAAVLTAYRTATAPRSPEPVSA